MAATIFLSPTTTLTKLSPTSSLHTRHYPNSDPPIYQVRSLWMVPSQTAIDIHYQLCVNTSSLHNPRSKAEHGKEI
ncbi:predicted protein [Lichtheimia corymbifera JMRC:FSU:9682]|uniref:Uncharacterized protein n=1 Tax=Lichtheimia corymbifera JMRC:FSU:9682 TaxID=1263082 RepID=A0A068SAM4_9FUNG|nr:predicted protein [Lichtheimia corymbifera JMRC:FSU:9682]